MITFIIALLVLVGGYFLYGSYVERVFGPDKIRKTPALTMADGVDFIPLPTWKIFMIHPLMLLPFCLVLDLQNQKPRQKLIINSVVLRRKN